MHNTAKTCFLNHKAFSIFYLKKITEYVNKNMNKNQSELNFADAGDAAHMENMLKEIYNNFKLEVQ